MCVEGRISGLGVTGPLEGDSRRTTPRKTGLDRRCRDGREVGLL